MELEARSLVPMVCQMKRLLRQHANLCTGVAVQDHVASLPTIMNPTHCIVTVTQMVTRFQTDNMSLYTPILDILWLVRITQIKMNPRMMSLKTHYLLVKRLAMTGATTTPVTLQVLKLSLGG